MAGDWIPMRTDLATDPAVIATACRLELDEDTVVGKLHRLWSWANLHSTDGFVAEVTTAWIDRFLGVEGFAAALIAVGWLSDDGGVRIPNYDRYNSNSAKNRLSGARRQQKKRRHDSVTEMSRDAVTIKTALRNQIYERDGHRCVYCGFAMGDVAPFGPYSEARLSIDHVIPTSRGGATTPDNLVTCCTVCNNRKNNRTPEEAGMTVTRHRDIDRDKSVTREQNRREEITPKESQHTHPAVPAKTFVVCEGRPPGWQLDIADAVEELRAEWGRLGLTPCSTVAYGSELWRNCVARLDSPWWRDHWRDGLAKIRTSDRLMGLAKGFDFRPTFSWFVRDEDNLRKLIDGEYDNKPPPPSAIDAAVKKFKARNVGAA